MSECVRFPKPSRSPSPATPDEPDIALVEEDFGDDLANLGFARVGEPNEQRVVYGDRVLMTFKIVERVRLVVEGIAHGLEEFRLGSIAQTSDDLLVSCDGFGGAASIAER
jgi:hypothetical protein